MRAVSPDSMQSISGPDRCGDIRGSHHRACGTLLPAPDPSAIPDRQSSPACQLRKRHALERGQDISPVRLRVRSIRMSRVPRVLLTLALVLSVRDKRSSGGIHRS